MRELLSQWQQLNHHRLEAGGFDWRLEAGGFDWRLEAA